MRKSLLVIAIILGFLVIGWQGHAVISAEEGEEVDNDLKVMSFNLRYDSSSDASPHTWQERRSTVQALIQDEAPDIIGMQEALHSQMLQINQDLPDYDWIGLGREGGSRGEYVPIFYKDERFTPIEYDHCWLSDTPEVIGSTTWGNSIPRMVTWVKFEEKGTGQQFYIVNTHFDHQSEHARQESGKLIAERITDFDEDLPVVLTGDFNANEESEHYKILTGEGLFTDAWDIAQDKENEHLGTFNGFDDPTGGGADNKIDWILTKGIEVKSMKVDDYRRDDGQFASDHYPVVAELDLEKAANNEIWSKLFGGDNDRMSQEEGINGPLRITDNAVVNVFDGAWIAYDNLDFTDVNITGLKINYAVNKNRSAPDGKLLVYADEMDEEHLITEIELEPTSESNWNTYESKEVGIEDASLLNKEHDIYIKMVGSTTASHPFILNLKYIQFQGIEGDNQVEAESIEINTDALTVVKKGESVQPEVVITPENTTDKQVNWEVQKPDMAEVLEDGTITAKESGTTKVTATTSNGKTASFTLRVTK